MQTRSQETKALQTDFGRLSKSSDKCTQAEFLESPSCVKVFPYSDHNISVHWQPVKHPFKIEGYKVVISINDQPWKPLCHSKNNYCTADVYHEGSVKIGVCSYKGMQESDVVYIETEINTAGSKMNAKKFGPKGSSTQSDNSDCNVGRKESDLVCTEKEMNIQVGQELVPEKLNSNVNSTQSNNAIHNNNSNVDSNDCSILSTTKLKVKPLLYHKVLHTPVKLTLLPVNGTSKRTMQVVRTKYNFHLKEELVRQIINSRDGCSGSYKTQVLVRFFMIKGGVIIHEDVLPDFIIRVNGDLALAQQKFKVLGGPLDITGQCNLREGKKSEVVLQIERLPSLKMNYCVMVCVAKKLDIPELVAKWLVYNVRHASKTRQMIQEKLNSDKDVSCTSLKITLTCPLGKGRIVSPCRGQNCEHVQCVDAFTLLKMNEGRPLSGTKCYMCDKPTGRIYIDGLFLDILSSVPDTVDKIEFRHDGSWTYMGQDDSSVQGKNCRQNERPWNESKEAIAESADEISDETLGPVSEKESKENVILDKVKSRLSEIKTQLNQLEVLSKQHEQCNIDSDRKHCHATDDGNIIDLSEEDDKNISSVENISGIQDNENIIIDSSEDEDEKIVSIVNSIRNQTQNDAEKREKILENEISRILKLLKQSNQEKNTGETGNITGSCEGQVHEKVALKKKTDVEKRTKVKKTGENLGNRTRLNKFVSPEKLDIGKTSDNLENSNKLRDIVRTKSVETTKVMSNDEGDKNKDSIRQFCHIPRILRKHLLQKNKSQSLGLKTQDCDVPEKDFNSVNSELNSELMAYGSEQELFKPDGTAVHESDFSHLETDKEKKTDGKLQTIQIDLSPELKLTCSEPFKSHLLQVTNSASESYASSGQLKLKGSNDTEVEKMQVGKARDHPATTENTEEKHLLPGSTIEVAQTSDTYGKAGDNFNVLHERSKSQTPCYSQSSGGSKDTGEMEENQVKGKNMMIGANLFHAGILKAKHEVDLAPPTKNQMKMAEVGMELKFTKRHNRVFNQKFLRYPSRTFHSKTLENLFTRNTKSWQKGGLEQDLEITEQEQMESDEIDCKNESQEKKGSCDTKPIESSSEKIEEDKLNKESLREKIEERKINKEQLREKIQDSKLMESLEQVDSVQGENEQLDQSVDGRDIVEEVKLNKEPLKEKIEEGKHKKSQEQVDSLQGENKQSGKSVDGREKVEGGKLNKEPLKEKIEEGKLKESQEQVDSLLGENKQLGKSVDGSILGSVMQDIACSLSTYKPLKIEESQIDSERGNAVPTELDDNNSASGSPTSEKGKPVVANVRSTTSQNLRCKKAQWLCSYCGKLSRTYRGFYAHLYSHTGVKPFVCEVSGCKQGFLSKNLLRRHQLVHTTCIYCKKHFGRKDFLERHLRTHEQNWSPWVCDICGKEHSYNFSFNFHKAFHAADQNETLTCGLCDRKFKNKKVLLSHLEAHAGTSGCIFCKDGDLICSVCKGSFDIETELLSNSNNGTKKNDFFCRLCKQHFDKIDHLTHHFRTEHEDHDKVTEKPPTRTVVSSVASQPKFTDEPALNSEVQPMILVPVRTILPSLPKNVQEQLKQSTPGSSHSENVSLTRAILLADQQYSVCQKPPPHFEVLTSVTDMCKKQKSTHITASLNSINQQERMPDMQNTISTVQFQTTEKDFAPDCCQVGRAYTSKFQVVPNITDKPSTQGLHDSTSVLHSQQQCQPKMQEPPNIQQKSLNTAKVEPVDVENAAEEQFITIQPLSSLAPSDASSHEQSNRAQVLMECTPDSRQKSLRLKKAQGMEVTQYSVTLKRKRKLKPRETMKRHVRMKASIPLKRNKEFDIEDYKIYA